MTDADMQMARCADVAKGLANARKNGVCSHESRTQIARWKKHWPEEWQCNDCDKVGTWESLEEDRREVLIEWT